MGPVDSTSLWVLPAGRDIARRKADPTRSHARLAESLAKRKARGTGYAPAGSANAATLLREGAAARVACPRNDRMTVRHTLRFISGRITLRITCGAKRRQVHPVVRRPAATGSSSVSHSDTVHLGASSSWQRNASTRPVRSLTLARIGPAMMLGVRKSHQVSPCRSSRRTGWPRAAVSAATVVSGPRRWQVSTFVKPSRLTHRYAPTPARAMSNVAAARVNTHRRFISM